MSLIDICKKCYSDFLETKQIQAAVLLDGVQHLAVFQNTCYLDELSPSPVQAAVILISLQKLYLDLQITPQDRREIYKNMNKIYRQVVDETKTEQLEAAIMVDLVLSITQAKQPENDFSAPLTLANRTYPITDFYMIAKMDDFVDMDDWAQEMLSLQKEKVTYFSHFDQSAVPSDFTCQNNLNFNVYDISEPWQKEERAQIEARIATVNDEILSNFSNFQLAKPQNSLKIDTKTCFFYQRKQVFDGEFLRAISKETAVQPVVKLSKLKHQKFYFLIGSGEFDERNLFYFLSKGKYVPFKDISAFGRPWGDQKKFAEEGGNVFKEMKMESANHVKIGGQEIVFINNFDKYKDVDIVKAKGCKKYFLDEGRLIGFIQTDGALKELQSIDIYEDEIFKLAGEHKISVFNFTKDEQKQGVNFFKIYKNEEENVPSVKKIWNLINQRIK